MTTIDSMKLKVTTDNLIYNKSNYHNTNLLQDGIELYDKMVLKKEIRHNHYGLNNVVIDEKEKSIIIEISAKVLEEMYMAGISNNTLDIVVDNVNKWAGLELTKIDYLGSNVLRGDLTKNLVIDDVRGSINVLKLGKSNSQFLVSDYNKANNWGIVFTGKVSSYKSRQIYYDKDTELTKVARNKDFIHKYGNKEFLKSFENVLRIEQNITQQKRLKNIFNIDTTRLGNILNSDINPVLDRHKIITKYSYGLELFDEYSSREYKLKEVLLEIGMVGILERCKNNLEVAEDYLKTFILNDRKNKSSVYNYTKLLREIYMRKTIEKDNNENHLYSNKLNEILELLKCA
jgi:hypothetical protein